MSVFEIEGVASRMAECDVAEITITFRAEEGKACELSRRVMDECDDFLEKIRKRIAPKLPPIAARIRKASLILFVST